MLKHFFLLSLTFFALHAQDFQVEMHHPFELPTIPDSLSLAEFQLLNRDLGWKELFTTIIFPGYASKYAMEDSLATGIMFGRYLGLAAMSVVAINALFNPDIEAGNLNELTDKSSANAAVFITGASANIMFTILDWGVANLRLKQKQDEILFKYRRKPNLRSVDVWNGMKKLNLP